MRIDAAERGATRAHPHALRAARGRATATLARDVCSAGATARARSRARAVVNAAGPWVEPLPRAGDAGARSAAGAAGQGQPHRRAEPVRAPLRLHLPEPRPPHRLRDPLRARVHADRHHRCRLSRRSGSACASTPPRSPTCARIANRYFTRSRSTPADVVWTLFRRAPAAGGRGNRPSSVTRDYRSSSIREPAPLLSVFGGKITTYRKLAEDAVDRCHGARLRGSPLDRVPRFCPGGDLPEGSFACSCARSSGAIRGCPRICARATRTPTARASTRVIGDRHELAELGAEIRPAALRARSSTIWPRGVGAQRRGHPVATNQARPAPAGGGPTRSSGRMAQPPDGSRRSVAPERHSNVTKIADSHAVTPAPVSRGSVPRASVK